MSAHKATLMLAALCCSAVALLPATASAAPAPAWTLSVTPMPANFVPAANPKPEYFVIATNVGAAPTTAEAAVIEATLPEGLVPTKVTGVNSDLGASTKPECKIEGQKITCETTEAVGSDRRFEALIAVEVGAAEGTYDLQASVKGGGAKQAVSTTFPTRVQTDPLDFAFLPGSKAPLTEEDGSPTEFAGSHPFQQTVTFAFPTSNPGDGITNSGHPRNLSIELPHGMLGNPAASRVLCTEAQLVGSEGCPEDSQIGIVDITTLAGDVGNNAVSPSPLYNMVPPPGKVAEIATNVAAAGIFVHIFAGLRSEGDYGVRTTTPDMIAFGTQPIFGIQAQIWGNPSAEAHDAIRGVCLEVPDTCEEVTRGETAFLTAPGDCPVKPSLYELHADTWEEPAPLFQEHRAFYESADLAGNPVEIKECGALDFEPTIQARPTTNRTDSPSGLDFRLHQPQDTNVNSRSTAALKDVAVHFPVGLAVNPAQAAGLDVCTEAQVGFKEEVAGQPRFFEAPQSCPEASKLGTVEATSPVLVARNEDQEVEEDPESKKPILEPVHGSIYLAKPFANPFDSLVAVYLVIEDPRTGIVAKLAGEGDLNEGNGQISTYFKENPEAPIEDISVHLFGGARGALTTPPACKSYETQATLTPWSAPEGKDKQPVDSFQPTAAPNDGACPATEAQMPNAPKLSANTSRPSAGAFASLLFKLTREDGTQRLERIESTLPTGVSAKLAGLAQCSEGAIAKAKSREAVNQGAAELADPSCPVASEIGTVVAAAGSGPNPYYAQGHAYLAGPYKGAPLSAVTIVPAVAGPFDLGAVVARVALYLDSTTAQVRAASDPLPTILHGVPVDLRSVALRAERPDFTLNPTSCDEKSFAGTAVSSLGSPAPLFQRFQVGGCKSLSYKPKLKVNLFGPIHRGGHPRLRATFTAKPGEANTARISFALPKSEFIDQAHFRTICTRVQFAANHCPAGSVYGHMKATSPLVDYAVEGPIYLRSSSHKLPDVVAALRGPARQPVEVDLDGRVDSVNGGIRTIFEVVPDLPVTKAIVSLQGGKKGLFQNSTNICKGTHRATLKLNGQNGKVADSKPNLIAQCPKGKGKGAKGNGGAKHKR
jgi:hypothetical protein